MVSLEDFLEQNYEIGMDDSELSNGGDRPEKSC